MMSIPCPKHKKWKSDLANLYFMRRHVLNKCLINHILIYFVQEKQNHSYDLLKKKWIKLFKIVFHIMTTKLIVSFGSVWRKWFGFINKGFFVSFLINKNLIIFLLSFIFLMYFKIKSTEAPSISSKLCIFVLNIYINH